jgi:hypothetical protein
VLHFVTHFRFLEPDLLKYHVENAILIQGRARNVSEEDAARREQQIGIFVQSFKQAQKVHQIRLELEAKGHPDHQRSEPYDLGQSIELESLNAQKRTLEDALQSWSVSLKRFTAEVPALLLLRDKLLLRAIQHIRTRNPDLVRIMPYIVLCLGDQLLHFRDQVYEVAGVALQNLVESRPHVFVCTAEEGLSQFAKLIGDIQMQLYNRDIAVQHEVDHPDRPKVFVTLVHKIESRDPKASIETTYEAMISQYLSDGGEGMVSPLSTQIVWGNKSTSIMEVKAWLQLARAPVNEDEQCIIHSLYFVAVDQISIPCRQVLLEGLLCQSDEWQQRLSVPVYLYFSSEKGLESFNHFPETASALTDTRTFKHSFQNSLWCFKDPNPPVSRLTVIAGDSGCGKSHWCSVKGQNLAIPPKCWLHIVVHEGFTVQLLINRYRAASDENMPGRIGIHFDVSEYCDLHLFATVMHDLLTSGLLVDNATGDAQVFLPEIEHFIFVELPALEKWPDTQQFHASQHPFLQQLPAIKFAVTSDTCYKTLSCRQHDHHTHYPLFNDCKTAYVAECLQSLSKNSPNFTFSTFQEHPFDAIDPELCPDAARVEADRVICGAFVGFGEQQSSVISKRILCNFVSLLFERCVYLSQMQEYTSNFEPINRFLYSRTCDVAFLAHFWVYSSQDITRLAQSVAVPALPAAAAAAAVAPNPAPAVPQQQAPFRQQHNALPVPYPYIPNFYAKLLHHCVNESAFLAGAHLPPNEPQVWVLRCNDYNKLRLLVSLPKRGIRPQIHEPEMRKVKLEDFMNKQVIIEMFSTAGKLEPAQREEIAPYFNLSSSSRFKQVVEQTEYVLTTEFLLKLFLLQGRRSCKSSLIFRGVRLFETLHLTFNPTQSNLSQTQI